MSRAPTAGFGPLEVFLEAEEGVSFKADNGYFLCPIQKEEDFIGVEAVKNKDQSCKFFIVEDGFTGGGKVRLKTRNGSYLRRTERLGRHPIEARMMVPDRSCEFRVCTRNGNVIFQSDNGLFLSRIYWTCPDVHTLEAAKTDADEYCEFATDVGDLIRPAFKVVETDCSSAPRKKKVAVSVKEYVNRSNSLIESHTFDLTWEKRVDEVTTWTRAWGLNSVISVNTNCFESRFPIVLLYDGVRGKSSSKERIISEAEKVVVNIPPKKKVTAKLVVNMEEDAEIDYSCRVKKTAVDGEVKTSTQRCTWKGTVYDYIGVEIEESSL